MQELIDDWLTYSRIESHAAPRESTNLNETLADVLRDMNASIVEAEAKITHDELPTLVSDSTQMHQLLQNRLLDDLFDIVAKRR